MNKSMLDLLNEVAVEEGYTGWYQVYSYHTPDFIDLNDIPQKAGKRYAIQYTNAKLDEVADQAKEMIYDIDGDNPLKGAGLVLRNFQVTYATPKQNILSLKDKI